jgi:hypothetical protein
MMREGRGRQLLPLKSGWSDNFEYAIWKRMTETELKLKHKLSSEMGFILQILIKYDLK